MDKSPHQWLAAVLLENHRGGTKAIWLDFWRTNESPECPAASDLLLHGSAGEIVLWSRGGEKNKFGKFGGGSEADSRGTLIGFSARGGEKQSRRPAGAADWQFKGERAKTLQEQEAVQKGCRGGWDCLDQPQDLRLQVGFQGHNPGAPQGPQPGWKWRCGSLNKLFIQCWRSCLRKYI